MRVNLALLSLVLASVFGQAFSQTKPAEGRAPATPDQRKPVSETDDVVRISVTLVQVDAVVTDKQGKRVTDLDKNDFEIYEDGKRQLITNFSFVSTQPPSAAPPAPRSKDRPELPLRQSA